ncbi:MAG: FISUMP domain-containing protein [Chitinophagales bacterium]
MTALANRVCKWFRIFVVGIFLTVAISCRTANQVGSKGTVSVNPYDSLLTDRDGNRYPIRIFADKNLWMTSNLKLNTPNSYCYDSIPKNCDEYGRLYTWESGGKGCNSLGKGWRLPGKADWQELSKAYAETKDDSIKIRKEAYQALLTTGSSGFNALLGGGRGLDGQFARLDAHGFYWMSTETDSLAAGFTNFAKGSQALYLQNDGEKSRAFSVRCVKSIDGSK